MTFQQNDNGQATDAQQPAGNNFEDLQAAIASWVKIKKASIDRRDDIPPLLGAVSELRALDQRLGKGKAAYRVRWALVKHAAKVDLSNFARALLPWVLDVIRRDGFIGWHNWSVFGDELGASKSRVSKAVKEYEEADLIRCTEGHRNRLVLTADGDIALGNRGPSYTFGLAGCRSFDELLIVSEVAKLETSEVEADEPGTSRSCQVGNFTEAEVANQETSNSRSFQDEQHKRSPLSSSPNQSSKPNELEEAPPSDEASATSDQPIRDGARPGKKAGTENVPENSAGHSRDGKSGSTEYKSDLLTPKVEIIYPSAIEAARQRGKAKVGILNYDDAVVAAIRRGAQPFQIEMCLRKAANAAQREAGSGDPTDSALLTKAAAFLEYAEREQIATPQPTTPPSFRKTLNIPSPGKPLPDRYDIEADFRNA